MSEPASSSAAVLVSTEAHALRNHLATMRSIVRLVDDPEVAAALEASSRALLLAIERVIVASRVDLGDAPAIVELGAEELLELARRRATREGADLPASTTDAPSPGIVVVPGPWAERLVADLLHLSPDALPSLEFDGAVDEIAFTFAPTASMSESLEFAMRRLAGACGGFLHTGDQLELRLPARRP